MNIIQRQDRTSFIRLAVVISLMVIFVLVWTDIYNKDTKELTANFLNVGQGDSILVEAYGGKQMLVDTGDGKDILYQLSKNVPFLDNRIEIILITHAHKDHNGGLDEVLKKYEVPLIIASKESLEGVVLEKENKVLNPISGLTVTMGKNTNFEIIFPDRGTEGWESNQSSVVGMLRHGKRGFLLMGDSPKGIEEYILSVYGNNLVSDVLKLGHHGSKTSSSLGFLELVSPEYSVISAGKNNRYGHPHKEALDNLQAVKTNTLKTENGTISFFTNGETLEVKQED